MPRPLSPSQIERLGIRLVGSAPPDPADLDQLRVLLSAYSEALGHATQRVRTTIGFSPSARVKNTGTILEKLERYGGSWLKSIQDLAGMRLVRSQTRAEQDALAEQIRSIFAGESRPPKIIDRRLEPVQGYRAVHIVVFPDSYPIEVQVRTRLQHEWAELFEKLADLLGRGIRYGEQPQHWLLHDPSDRLDDNDRALWLRVSTGLRSLVPRMIEFADLIDLVEHQERNLGEGISRVRPKIDEALSQVRSTLDTYAQLEPIYLPADEVT